MSPALIYSLKNLTLSIFLFSHSLLLWNCAFIFIKSRRNNFLTRYISLIWNFNFWLWVDQLTFLKRVCRKAWLRKKLREPQNPTRLTQVNFSLQTFIHSLDVSDLYGEEAEGRQGPLGLGFWGFRGMGFTRDQSIGIHVICFSSKFMNLIYLMH